jgi:hypothetical protein
MFKFRFFKPKAVKKIAFLDGDQALVGIVGAYQKYLIGTETHLVRALTGISNGDPKSREPKILRDLDINKIYLDGYTKGKEIVDKFIGAYIQKAIGDGYKHITVVSSDYDFIDIFKMAVVLNPMATDVTFRIIVPHAQGKLAEMPDQVANIEVVRI